MCTQQQQPVRNTSRGLLRRFGNFMAGSSPSRNVFHKVTVYRTPRLHDLTEVSWHESSRACKVDRMLF